MINPEEDGITHINIYSKGKTSLGRFLSNFTQCTIMTKHGEFESVEGYWYYLLNIDNPRKDELRFSYGFNAKKLGRELSTKDWNDTDWFKGFILDALLIKINNCLSSFSDNQLPFVHYYNYGGKVIEPKEGKWIIDFFNSIRENNVHYQRDEDLDESMW